MYETSNVDSALSTTSIYPVQNKVVTANINSINSQLSTLNSDLTNSKNSLSSQINSLNSNLANVFISKGTNIDWKSATGIYFYEGADTTTYDIPYNHIGLIHMCRNGEASRAVAIAIRWAFPTENSSDMMWIRRRHDTWSDWVQIK